MKNTAQIGGVSSKRYDFERYDFDRVYDRGKNQSPANNANADPLIQVGAHLIYYNLFLKMVQNHLFNLCGSRQFYYD